MKSLNYFLILFLTLGLAACSGGGGSAQEAPAEKKTEAQSPQNQTGREESESIVVQDCGSHELSNCNLFGLKAHELAALRKIIPFHLPSSVEKEEGFDLLVSRAVLMTDVVKRRFPHADTRIGKHNRAKVISFYHSIPWM